MKALAVARKRVGRVLVALMAVVLTASAAACGGTEMTAPASPYASVSHPTAPQSPTGQPSPPTATPTDTPIPGPSPTPTATPVSTPAPPGFIVDGGVVTDTWQHFSVDFPGVNLQPLAGQDVTVRFYTVHDGDKYGTYFYLDDLECNICTEEPIPDPEPGTASIGGLVQAVVGNLNQSMPGVTVVAYSPGGEVYQTLSIHDATCHFYNIPPGTYTVYAQTWVEGVLKFDSATVTVVSDERNYYVNLRLQ